MIRFEPQLVALSSGGIRLLVDPRARERGVLVAFSDRWGGVSAPPFDTLNLGATVGDVGAAVARNRRLVAEAAGYDEGALALARQVHGSDLLEVAPGSRGVVGEADGIVARAPGVVLGILTADCAPVVVAGEGGVALLHAGWRGLAAGIVERGVEAVSPARCAWVGPSIRACCYEVGPEVTEAFARRGLPVGSGRVDVGASACRALARAGVAEIAASGDCTACNSRYFSHRRDGVTGRQGAFVGVMQGSVG